MELLRLVVVLCALHMAKPLDSVISPVEYDLRLHKRQEPDVIIPTGVMSGFVEARVNCTVEYPCVALDADSVEWTLLGVGSVSLPESPGRSVNKVTMGRVTVATLILDPVIPAHEEFYVCQIQGGSSATVNIFVDVIEEPLLLEANTPMSNISSATEGTQLPLLCTTTTCLEGVSVRFYREGPPHMFLFEDFGESGNQTFVYNHVITLNSAGNYFCQAEHTNVETNEVTFSTMEFFTIHGTPIKATQPPTDGSTSGTTPPPSGGGTTPSGGGTTPSTGEGTISVAGGTPSLLFQGALSLTLLLVIMAAMLMN